MKTGGLKNLKQVRERLLGYTLAGAARLSGIGLERLQEIERGDAPSVLELDRLSHLYGIDAETLGELEFHVDQASTVTALASSEEFKEIGDGARSRIVAAASAAKDLMDLRGLLDDPDAEPLPSIAYGRQELNYNQGAEAAKAARKLLRIGSDPIPSLRDLVAEQLPQISILYARLGTEGPAGLTFAGEQFGATIVLNVDGKNKNPCVRRFSLAHELCHLLLDWDRGQPLAQISSYYRENSQERAREQRANAFAIRFLCPESVADALPEDPVVAAKRLITEFGVHYTAARLYLRNRRNMQLPYRPPIGLGALSVNQKWEEAEAPLGITGFPLEAVPVERQTMVAFAAAQAYAESKIARDAFADYLRLTPIEEVESVLDFFALDGPSESEPASAA